LPRWTPSELPRSKEALVFAWGANASASPLFHTGGENRLAYWPYGFRHQVLAESKGIDDAFANALHVLAMQIYEEIQAISETREKLSHSIPEAQS
jgi:hypothetical protein